MAKNNSILNSAVNKEGAKIGIDLGTANTLVYISGYGIVFDEPTIVAYDAATRGVIACGNQAKDMVGKIHDKIRLVYPMNAGVVADIKATRTLLEYVFGKLGKLNFDFKKSTLLICCPAQITEVERKALMDLAKSMGIEDSFVEPEIKAGAIGADIDIYGPEGSMVVDIGAGSTNVGVLSCGDVVVLNAVRTAGDYIDNEIIKYMKVQHNLIIGAKTAERIKMELATLLPEDVEKTLEAGGRHLSTGRPDSVIVKQEEIYPIVLRAFEQMKHCIQVTLEQTPPELSSDIIKGGISVIGGGAAIRGVKEFFEANFPFGCHIAENGMGAIVKGTKQLLKNRGNYLVRPED